MLKLSLVNESGGNIPASIYTKVLSEDDFDDKTVGFWTADVKPGDEVVMYEIGDDAQWTTSWNEAVGNIRSYCLIKGLRIPEVLQV